MEPLIIDRDSRLTKIANFGGMSSWEVECGEVDTCKYRSYIAQGLAAYAVVGTMMLAVAGAILFVIGDVLAFLLFIAINGFVEPSEAIIVIGMVLFVGVLGFLAHVLFKGIDVGTKKISNTVTGAELYKSWKEKHCHKVAFIDDGRDY